MNRFLSSFLASIIVLLILFSMVNVRSTRSCSSAHQNRDSVRSAIGRNIVTNLNVFAFGYYRPTGETNKENRYFFLSGYRLRPGVEPQQNASGIRFEENFTNAGGLGAVLIPVTKSTYMVIMIFCWMVALMLLLLIIYAFAIEGSGLLVRITKGNSFNEKNIQALFFIGWTLLGMGLLPFISNGIASSFLGNRIPNGVHFNWLDNINRWQGWILAGLVVLLFARAFKKGYELQIEQSQFV